MGAGWYLLLPFYLLVGGVCVVLSVPDFINRDATDSICNIPGCNCTYYLTWQKINCTFNDTQKVQFTEGSIPNVTMEISITGGKEILIKPMVFKSLPAFRRFKVENTMSLTTSKGAFVNVTSPKVIIQIQGCDELKVEDNAFEGFPPKTPLDFEATNCSRVSIGKSAFTTLQYGRFQFIRELILAKEAFSNEARRHGLLADVCIT
ncbi:uncharacterized protein LOC108741476 isoform X1 [Agrilus planipennis]|uniref:Uncharacterized protein LOC108741476 isoform X1 n=1 Tax=Agrilus planipennis TaxID=224129 RepID=A0A7F5QWU7_AGRPL|nr:uncharacterized protein LOC108741476 isoform X1 [Agrilus planipennis]